MSKATLAQVLHIGGMFESGEYDREMAQAIIDKRVVIKPPASAYRGELPSGTPSDTSEPRKHHCVITVATAVLPTYADLVSSYGEGNVNSLWDESKYKLELQESLRELTPPTGEVTVFLKKFDRSTTSDKAIKWADEHGYRLLFPWEREAFSKANPDLQRKFWIVDLGSFALGGGGRCVPVLGGGGGRRCLGNDWFAREWRAGFRFLFAAK